MRVYCALQLTYLSLYLGRHEKGQNGLEISLRLYKKVATWRNTANHPAEETKCVINLRNTLN